MFAQGAFDAVPDGRVLFAADARLDNQSDIAAAAGLAKSASDEASILSIFERKSERGIASLLGAFAFAHWNEATGKLVLARDCLGNRSLFYYKGRDFVAFSSFLPDLLALPLVPRSLDEAALASFLAFDFREKERTVYSGIARVPARHCVTITRDSVDIRAYWQPTVDPRAPTASEDALVDRARALFDRAVARAIRDTPRVAVQMSGGLDSTAVAATAIRLGHADVASYTGLPAEGYARDRTGQPFLDERPLVEALARMYPSLDVHFVTPQGAHPFHRNPVHHFLNVGGPVRSPVGRAWFDFIDDAIVKDGHRIVLAGMRGNVGLSWTGDDALAWLARRRRFGELLREARALARTTRQPVWRILATEVLGRMAPRAAHRLYGRLRGRDPDDVSRFSLLNPQAIAEFDLPRRWRENGFDPWYRTAYDSVEERSRRMFDLNQTGRDLLAARVLSKGYEFRDPHADRELLEFCLTVPETMYRRNGVARSFARRVLMDRLPAEILNEKRRGMQVPNWFESLNELKPSLADSISRIESSPLACRLIDVPRLKRLYSSWPETLAAARQRHDEYHLALDRAVHVGQFISWVEGGNTF
ncbi:MAG TPA: asparagine synthase-related protein [Pseudolabrys sp.]|nr:asparagine synthase-related protein [Pseudolabrys sp.]